MFTGFYDIFSRVATKIWRSATVRQKSVADSSIADKTLPVIVFGEAGDDYAAGG